MGKRGLRWPSRTIHAAPSVIVSAGLFIWVLAGGGTPDSMEDAVGPFSEWWLGAIIVTCTVNVVLALLPKWSASWYLAEIAARVFAAALLAGFAYASWTAPSGHRDIQGVFAAAIACWHVVRWRQLRREADEQAVADQARKVEQ